jgi:hypothetical protein
VRHGAIEIDHRRRRDLAQNVIELGDPGPIGLLGPAHPCVARRERRLQGIRAAGAAQGVYLYRWVEPTEENFIPRKHPSWGDVRVAPRLHPGVAFVLSVCAGTSAAFMSGLLVEKKAASYGVGAVIFIVTLVYLLRWRAEAIMSTSYD